MPKKSGKGLAAHLGSTLAKSVQSHKGDETNLGLVDLPPGIKNGICQVTDCRFSQYKSGPNEGEYFFLAAGTVITPKSVATEDGVISVQGLRTQIMRPVCDTKNQAGKVTTTDEHVSWILNEFRKLGVDTSEIEDDDLEQVAADLKEAKPYFRMSTTQGKPTPQFPNPRTWENWHGSKGLEDYDPEDADEPEFTETEEPTTVEVEASEDNGDVDENDLDALAANAQSGNEVSGAKLEALAEELKVNDDAVTAAETWAEVVGMIREAQSSEKDDSPSDLQAIAVAADEEGLDACGPIDEACEPLGIDSTEYSSWVDVLAAIAEATESHVEETGGTDEEKWKPEVEEIYYYKPPRAQKSHECEVKTVNQAASTVTLERLDDKKTFNKVPWDKLSGE